MPVLPYFLASFDGKAGIHFSVRLFCSSGFQEISALLRRLLYSSMAIEPIFEGGIAVHLKSMLYSLNKI
jgi:hypothetical protein